MRSPFLLSRFGKNQRHHGDQDAVQSNQYNGWDDIEPMILAALVSELPVLLIGDIGSNKTEGSEAISRALLGTKIDFRAYEVPTLNFDDLIGFMNPKSLVKGELDFVHTPLSIWKADAVLFDEINRAKGS